jgi:hypothetical protein
MERERLRETERERYGFMVIFHNVHIDKAWKVRGELIKENRLAGVR